MPCQGCAGRSNGCLRAQGRDSQALLWGLPVRWWFEPKWLSPLGEAGMEQEARKAAELVAAAARTHLEAFPGEQGRAVGLGTVWAQQRGGGAVHSASPCSTWELCPCSVLCLLCWLRCRERAWGGCVRAKLCARSCVWAGAAWRGALGVLVRKPCS